MATMAWAPGRPLPRGILTARVLLTVLALPPSHTRDVMAITGCPSMETP